VAEQGSARVLSDRVVVARTVLGRGRAPIGSAVVVFSLAPENAAFAASRRRIFWLSFALAAVTALVLIVLARALIVRPLAELGQAARRIGGGALGTRVTIASNDEMGELAFAFNAMGERLADRERRLAAATQSLRDLFDHMRQAILAFGPDGKVQGAVSRSAAAVFGDTDLEGAHIRTLLYPDAVEHDVDAQAFDEWIAMAFQVSLDQWEQLAALAPHEVVLERPTGGPLPLELEFLPIVKGNAEGAIERIMLLATDVSERRALQAAVHTQEEEHARRMAAMRRLIAGGGQIFVAFMDAARERLARCTAIVGGEPRRLSIAEIDELFQHIHTIKGEARAFELNELETETAKLEEDLDELRAAARGGGFATTGSVHGLLVDRLARTRDAIDKGGDVFVAASPIGRAALDQITVQRSDVHALLELVGTRHDTIARIAAGLASRPFGESAAALFEMAPSWGEEEGKRVILDVVGREVRVPSALARVLGGVLTHLVRNAVAHGIEIPVLRERAGKRVTGVVRLEAREGPAGPEITVEDDGAGLDLRRLEERAVALGAQGSGADLVFTPGLSTLDTASLLAGRGVGLSAVRADLAAIGYAITVTFETGKYTRFVIRPADATAD
jgi:HAMP domain-containing protein/HPt (histidine-containing phosphotransfer) domain-containing protein